MSENQDPKPELLSKEEAEKVLQTAKATRAERDAAKRELEELKGQLAAAKAADEQAKLEAKGDYEKLKANLQSQLDDLAKERDEATSGFKRHVVKAELTAALAAHKGNQHLLRLMEDQFEAVIGPDGPKVLVKGDPTKTPAQFVEALKKDPSYLAFFEGSGASGGAAPSGASGAAGGKVLNLTDFKTLKPVERAAFVAAGGTVKE